MESNQDLFISHSSADSKLAYAMCDYLEKKGIRCWIAPRDVNGGTDYAEAIIMGIRSCKIMVVLYNKNANDSIYVKNEVERAFNYKSILIPFKVDQTIPSATLELFLGSVHSIDATKGNPEDCFGLLYQNCARVLGKKERVIEEKPVISINTETKESPVKEIHLLQKEENNIQITPPNNSVPSSTIQWVSIPSGTFMMGSPASEIDREDDETQHEVSLSAFKMSAYEVTFDQYDAFCVATKRKKPSDQGWGRGKRPVINVSWDDATAFAKWVGARLPTEAEWEYACRAGSTSPFNTGSNLTTNQANYNGDFPYNNNALGIYREQSTEVGSFAPNAFGLYDMHGNVWEWCSDWYGEYPSSPQTNPRGSSEGSDRVLRGGSWGNFAHDCRAACRLSFNPDYRLDTFGFRLVSPE